MLTVSADVLGRSCRKRIPCSFNHAYSLLASATAYGHVMSLYTAEVPPGGCYSLRVEALLVPGGGDLPAGSPGGGQGLQVKK